MSEPEPLDPEEAEDMFTGDGEDDSTIPFTEPTGESSQDLDNREILCPECNRATPKEKELCTFCNIPLPGSSKGKALISCAACNNEISIKARECPNCGHPNDLQTKERSDLAERSDLVAGLLGFFLGPVGLWYKGKWMAGFAWLFMTVFLSVVTLGVAAPFCWIGMAVHAADAETKYA